MPKTIINIFAIFLLVFVFFVSLGSTMEDSLTMDELAHLPAGFSYLTQRDMRLNPEHPPLIKDIAAFPLLFIEDIQFPFEIKDWKEDVNGQWGFGFNFLYNYGNPSDKMIFLARIPMIFILILTGFYIFKFSKEFFGDKVALLSLFIFSFSPTFLAHGRLVTTDVGAAFGVVISIYYFLKALKNPTKKNIILAGIAFGIGQLLKFTLILLIPLFIFLTISFWFFKNRSPVIIENNFRHKNFKIVLKTLFFIFLIGYILVLLVYIYHTLNYPPEKQANDIKFLLSSHPLKFLVPLLEKLSYIPILKAFSQYLLGLFRVLQIAGGDHTTYFLGEVSTAGWKNYFPVVYAIKEPLSFHFLTIIALLFAAWQIKKPLWQNPFSRFKNWLNSHFVEFSMICFVIFYWITSVSSNLNIGVRHLLPVYPFTIILVSLATIKFIANSQFSIINYKIFLIIGLLFWQAISVLSIYPYFLAYFNEIVDGPDKGYLYVVDSNLDWGQDLKRLKKWVDEQGIEKIYVDYFGGADTKYYLKEKYIPWEGTKTPQEIERPAYLAVSATLLQGGRGKPVSGFDQPYGYYLWLDKEKLVKKIGYSIFVYYLK